MASSRRCILLKTWMENQEAMDLSNLTVNRTSLMRINNLMDAKLTEKE